jgi:DNA-binding CsgD family transcriptional regulator
MLNEMTNKIINNENNLKLVFEYGDIKLSVRETQCLAYKILGMTAKQIGELLFLSSRTVESYLESVKNKFDSTCRYKIILYVLSHGFPLYKFVRAFNQMHKEEFLN